MAEFCLECWNELNGTNDSEKEYIMSKDLDLCEGCGEYKRVIVAERKIYYFGILFFLFRPLIRFGERIYFFLKLVIPSHLDDDGKDE